MIILSGGGAAWGLPEISPFVTKTEVHLRMAGLDYSKRQASPEESPKGQIPFIDDGGKLIGDSTFIRFHIEREYGIYLDQDLTPFGRATAVLGHRRGPTGPGALGREGGDYALSRGRHCSAAPGL